MHFNDTALVLEGGGMRGVFTCGVLDALMKYDIHFPYVVGVSAGACNGLSYASWQPGRAKKSNIDLLEQYRYIGINHLIRTGCIFDPDLLYRRLPNELLPYDYDAYFKSGIIYEQVVTNCLTGRAEYLSEYSGDRQRLLDICHASSSLPYVSKIVMVDGIPYLDGGIVDSVPIVHAMEKGYKNYVIVMTRNRGFRHTSKDIRHKVMYAKYPRLRVALSRRHKWYNETMELVERLEDEKRIHVIWPEKPIRVGRMEKSIARLEDLYNEGVAVGEEFCKSVLQSGCLS